ncbi:MAG: 2-oxo acid dehydrogenase subunit E2, partial [Legionellales bacterium]|nr:2-oxo acid dehydrogenase subunit E2 [Legionellales bacterium]
MTNMNTNTLEVCVPDIGGTVDVEVIEVLVKVGDVVTKEQSLVTLEGDKATMEIPSPAQGVVEKIVMKVGDRVAQGALILVMSGVDEEKGRPQATIPEPLKDIVPEVVVEPVKAQKPEPVQSLEMGSESFIIGAGPSVRRMARELGVNLADVHGTGRKSRISKDDLTTFVKQIVQEKTSTGGLSIPSPVAIDFSQWGAIEVKPLNKIKRLTGVNVHRSWVTIPHVTQFDEADITALEQFRKAEKTDGYKLTLLAFVCKVVVQALKRYPEFNASLDPTSQNLIYKQYFNIGIAVETPHGLVVPVMKAVDTLSVGEIAQEMARLSTKAREKGL